MSMNPVNNTSETAEVFIGRQFIAPTVFDGKPLALGRIHSSWFLVFPKPNGETLTRAAICLNFTVPGDPSTVSIVPSGDATAPPPRFTVGGTQGLEVLKTLNVLRDRARRPPVRVVKYYEDPHQDPAQLRAVVEVAVPEDELIRACARCGRWEATSRPRFRRCGRCKCTYYCSRECQRDDWQPDFHKDDCDLLREGKMYEVECRRSLHYNGWWFSHGLLVGPARFTELLARKRAVIDGDEDALTFGRRTPPRDLPVQPTQAASGPQGGPDDNPSGRTVNPSPDAADASPENATPGANARRSPTPEDVSWLPPLPYQTSFVLTGDPEVDEQLFLQHVRDGRITVDRHELDRLLTHRRTLRKLARELWAEEVAGEESGADSDTESEGSMPSLPTVSESSDDDYSVFWDAESDDTPSEDGRVSDSESGGEAAM